MYRHVAAQPEVHGLDETWHQRGMEGLQGHTLSLALGLAATRIRKAMGEAQGGNVKRRRQAARKRLDAGKAPNAMAYKALRTYVPEGLAFLKD
eukprot:12812368-Alexandrium_andersonii.AAC.1